MQVSGFPILWNVMQCPWVIGFRRFDAEYCPHLQGLVGLLGPIEPLTQRHISELNPQISIHFLKPSSVTKSPSHHQAHSIYVSK
jgi:hypothetical protein